MKHFRGVYLVQSFLIFWVLFYLKLFSRSWFRLFLEICWIDCFHLHTCLTSFFNLSSLQAGPAIVEATTDAEIATTPTPRSSMTRALWPKKPRSRKNDPRQATIRSHSVAAVGNATLSLREAGMRLLPKSQRTTNDVQFFKPPLKAARLPRASPDRFLDWSLIAIDRKWFSVANPVMAALSPKSPK